MLSRKVKLQLFKRIDSLSDHKNRFGVKRLMLDELKALGVDTKEAKQYVDILLDEYCKVYKKPNEDLE